MKLALVYRIFHNVKQSSQLSNISILNTSLKMITEYFFLIHACAKTMLLLTLHLMSVHLSSL